MSENEPQDDGTPAPVEPHDAGPQEEAVEDELPHDDPAASLSPHELRAVLEALIFVAKEPITPRVLGQVLQGTARADWEPVLEELRADYARPERGLQLIEVAGGYQITTRPEWNDYLRELLDPKSPTKLSIQALETLAVIAYKQPVTLPEVIELRGVKSGGVIKTLLEKRLIRIVGRKEVVGRPMLYGTTKEFLLNFGLKDLGELPKIEEFAEVLGEEVDVAGLKRAIEAPRPVEVPLTEDETAPGDGDAAPGESAPGEGESDAAEDGSRGQDEGRPGEDPASPAEGPDLK